MHEVIGFAFFATVIVHLALSAKWIKNTASTASKGKLTARRTALAVMGILLALNVVVLGVSSVAISTILESAGFTWAFGSYATWAAVHAVSAYSFCALVAVHLAMHWAFLASAFRVPYDPSRRRAISTGVHAAAAVGALALGVMAVNQVAPIANASSGNSESSNGNGTTTQSRNGNAFASVNDTASSSSSSSASTGSSTSSSPSQGAKGKGKTKGGSASSGSASSSGSSAATSQGSAPSQGGSDFSQPDANTDSSTASGICTLCHKECPLSNPKCDKPYRQGLL